MHKNMPGGLCLGGLYIISELSLQQCYLHYE